MSDYTPSTDEVREAWRTNPDGPKRLGSRFDRWLESVRAEERERIARLIHAANEYATAPEFAQGVSTGLSRAEKIAREGA